MKYFLSFFFWLVVTHIVIGDPSLQKCVVISAVFLPFISMLCAADV